MRPVRATDAFLCKLIALAFNSTFLVGWYLVLATHPSRFSRYRNHVACMQSHARQIYGEYFNRFSGGSIVRSSHHDLPGSSFLVKRSATA
eukprot:6206136-Pleurochrysis_carterae.AAC.1